MWAKTFACVCGKREQGKSTLALAMAEELSPRAVIWDPRLQFEVGVTTSDYREFRELLDEEKPRFIVYQPLSIDDDEEFPPIANEIFERGRYSVPASQFTFLVDEAQDLAQSGESLRALSRLARKTKRDTVALIFTYHRPMDVRPIFRALPTDFYVFRQTLDDDLDWLRRNISPEVAERTRTLPDHHFIHAKVDQDQWRIIDTPEVWFVEMTGRAERRDPYHEVQAGR